MGVGLFLAAVLLASLSLPADGQCPPLFIGPNCSSCFSRQQIICSRNRSYLHVDYRLFTLDGSQLMGHSIFELTQTNRPSLLDRVYREMVSDISELNNDTCGPIHRDSTNFCSRCQKGYALSPYTYYGVPCTKCSPQGLGWLWYIFLELCFPTLIFFCSLLFRIRITSGVMIGFVFYCQVVANTFTSPYFRYLLEGDSRRFTQIILTVYGFWNMDFFRFVVPQFCVSESLGTLEAVALGYVSAFYPLFLTLAVYCLIKLHQRGWGPLVAAWRPFHWYSISFKRRFLRGDASLIDTFATFLLLSYSKIILVSLQLVRPMKVYNITHGHRDGSPRSMLRSIDPAMLYLKNHHLYYGLLAMSVLMVFTVLPTLILCLHPTRWGRRQLSRWKLTASKDFNRLVSAFQVSFKNGREDGFTDYRAVAAIHIAHRITIFFSNIFLQGHDFITYEPFLMQAVLFVATFAFYAYAQPHRKFWHTCMELLLLTLLTAQSLICFKLYGACPYQGPSVNRCSGDLQRIIKVQLAVLCVPQAAFLVYLLGLVGRKFYLISMNLEARCFSLVRYPSLREYTSLETYS